MCVTFVTCEVRVCGLRCRSGSSLYIYRVYSSWSGDRVATVDARLGMAVVEDTTTLRRASGPIVGTMNAPPEPTKRVRANATSLICIWLDQDACHDEGHSADSRPLV